MYGRYRWAEEVEHWYPFLEPSHIHLIRGNKDKLYLKDLGRSVTHVKQTWDGKRCDETR